MRDTHAHLTWRLNFGIARGLAALPLALLTMITSREFQARLLSLNTSAMLASITVSMAFE